ncbi:LysM peptidoglycan-binding domain-containing protein [Snodgrassella alvi]|uniref:LysM peptidoglycan-binding domain-containing protein n=1 Tax=Snodgrassella alvi TaxID=1196083 RepID=UPI000C1F752D|nr:LysM peptidoglycan-binding domain-containing protein [Snodgrassella alvi]PIT10977.1 peptidoglycan-binding protein LysM [Snodgrassella alvi]PIT47994.1 peptidoglycan-binding protein LysM [Snodgrassella alvi]PIT58964.1 peptidoglycan-binding protein LysM [Snodgrassella alvi]
MHKHIITLLCTLGMAISAPAMAELKLRPDAPTQYVVKNGDTLWSISGKYLYSPWQWPQLWGSNRAQIQNPQKIYPGQVLTLRYVDGQPRLGFDDNSGIPTIKLQPRVRNMSSGYGINTVDVDFYRIFMQHPQVIDKQQTRKAPRLIAGPESRVMFATGDRVYADRPLESGNYLVYRIEKNITDPDTHKYLGQLVRFSGEVATLAGQNSALAERSPSEAASLPKDEYYTRVNPLIKLPTQTAQPLVVTNTASEISKGDYLLKITDEHDSFQMMPHAPKTQVKGKIISVMDGTDEAGTYHTITLNLGSNDGVDKGTVVSLYKKSHQLKTGIPTNSEASHSVVKYLSIPAEEVGLALIYRVSDKLSSALIISTSSSVKVGDMVMNPGHDLDDVTQHPRHTSNSSENLR